MPRYYILIRLSGQKTVALGKKLFITDLNKLVFFFYCFANNLFYCFANGFLLFLFNLFYKKWYKCMCGVWCLVSLVLWSNYLSILWLTFSNVGGFLQFFLIVLISFHPILIFSLSLFALQTCETWHKSMVLSHL